MLIAGLQASAASNTQDISKNQKQVLETMLRLVSEGDIVI